VKVKCWLDVQKAHDAEEEEEEEEEDEDEDEKAYIFKVQYLPEIALVEHHARRDKQGIGET
jgi:hypothetical protein